MSASPYVGPERRWTPRFLRVGSVAIPYVSREKALQTIHRSFVDDSQIRVAFCNVNMMNLALQDETYATALRRFLVLNDGIGVDLFSRLFNGHPFESNLNGTDFVPEILATSLRPLSIYLLGARAGIVRATARRIAADYPRHTVVGFRDGYFEPGEVDGVIAEINATRPDLLLVAMGNPRQEQFIAGQAGRIDARVLIGVGALFDFLSGDAPRAPRVVRAARLEWLFRLAREPLRLGRRYTLDIVGLATRVLHHRVTRRPEPEAASGKPPRLRPED